MATEFHAVGMAYRTGQRKGFVVVRFTVEGTRVTSTELVSPEPEPIHFAAARLKSQCAALLQAAKESAENA